MAMLASPTPTLSPRMLLSVCFVVVTGVLLQANTFDLGTSPIVDTGYASYLGNRTFPNTVAYLGVSYAEPPLGDQRFRAPIPLNRTRISQDSNGVVIDATRYPEFCIQGTTGGGDAGGAGSEDCLKVNIYTPAGARRGSKLPVLVYIHGGSYIFGNPANWPFDHWIHQNPNVVIVSVYYRLSSFGFLATPEFHGSNIGDFNAGFYDQIEALKWVQENIASFGGNPDKVTISGESAGGSSVELHLVANMKGRNLFSGAIAQSVYRTPLPTPEDQRPLFQFYAEHAGCGLGPITAQMACLRTASVNALARAQDAGSSTAFNGSLYKTFHPVIDGQLIPDFPTRLVMSGSFTRVPVIVGATTNETLAGGNDLVSALKPFCPKIDIDDTNELLEAYPSTAFSSESLRLQTVTGDVTLRCARTILASAYSSGHVTAWTYRYNQRNPTSSGTGVGHAAENWMMFRGTNTGINGTTTFTSMTSAEMSFAEELIAYWLSFVRTGNPNVHKLARSPVWPTYTSSHRARMVLQQETPSSSGSSGSVVELEGKPETERCNVIASQADHQQN
ncbi:Acylcarnitine hydrolase [Hypsizygus marmoreus]|uniref:Carboxylic ester hydrolase n=1 Tax=Hypsizygus marmoreus TaxID=39966 RepID=A0A369JV55_HYPMA|nr:Acylcarnitine hydrolase [Hypsizygus marmoreus]